MNSFFNEWVKRHPTMYPDQKAKWAKELARMSREAKPTNHAWLKLEDMGFQADWNPEDDEFMPERS